MKDTPQNKAADKTDAEQTAIVEKSTDKKTDQDFPGFPNLPAGENIINPATEEDKIIAAVDKKDGEKRTPDEQKNDHPS